MHTCLVLPYLEEGGTEEHVFTLARFLAGEGIQVSVIAPSGARDQDLDRLPVRRLRFVRFDRSLRRGLSSYRSAVCALVEAAPPDVLHVHGGHELLLALPRKARRIPAVFTSHGFHGKGKSASYRTAAWVCNRMARRSIAVSAHEAKLMRRFGFDAERLRLIYNGIEDPTARKRSPLSVLPRSFPDAAFRVGAVARLEAPKGIEYLIRAMARIRTEPVVCLIMGEGSLRGALEELARTLSVADSVYFCGRVPDASAHIQDLDVLVVPSLEEPFGLVCAEAMACGKPVIASRVGGIPEVVADGETGLLVPPGNDARLAEAILRLYRDRDLTERMGRAGRERFLERFSAERMGRAVVRLYEEILAERLAGRGASR